MKKYIAALFIALIPYNAYSFELTVPFSWGADGFHIGEYSGDIMQIAMKYNGYDTKNNRKELQALMDIDPVKTPWCAGFVNFVLARAGYDYTGNLTASSYHS